MIAKGESQMTKFVAGLVGFVFFVAAIPTVVQAGADFVPYKPGIVKSAIAKGETAILFFKSTYWGTCARQDRVLKKLRAGYPQYNKFITFVIIDWDTYKNHEVTTSRNIPRRSTMVLIKGGKEAKRLVAQTSEQKIKALLDNAVK